MTAKDYKSLVCAAQCAGMPLYAMGIFLALLKHANYRWQCYPSVRRIALLTGISKNTVTTYTQWLCDAGVISRKGGMRTKYRYQIQHKKQWVLSQEKGQFSETNLSQIRRQISVPTGGTDEKADLHKNCPSGWDVTKDNAIARNGSATAEEEDFAYHTRHL